MAVTRIDRGTFRKAKIDDRGYLIADAYFTRAGIFLYRKADGSIQRELRPPEEVFKKESLDSLSSLVVTRDHPADGLLNSENTKKYSVGFTGDTVEREGLKLKGKMIVSDKEAVSDVVDKGKDQNSCGYVCDMDNTPGIWEGKPYDSVQRNILYNHVAIVDRGRAGPEIKIKLDAQDAIMIDDDTEKEISGRADGNEVISESDPKKSHEGEKIMAKIKVDNGEYEVTETVALALNQKFDKSEKELADVKADSKKEVEAVKKELEGLKGKNDALEGELKKRDEAIAAMKKDSISDKEMEDRVRERIAARSFAKEILGAETKVDEIEIGALKKQVVSKSYPDINVEKKDASYIDAAFDVLKRERKHDAAEAIKKELGETIIKGDQQGALDDVDKIRQDKMEKDSKSWMKPIGHKVEA